MIRPVLIIVALVSVVAFPWPLALAAAIAASIVSPLAPLAAGVLADTLSFAPHAAWAPLGTLTGAFIALASFGAQVFFKTRILQA